MPPTLGRRQFLKGRLFLDSKLSHAEKQTYESMYYAN